MLSDLMFYQPFLSRETKKLIDMVRFYLNYSSVSSSVPNAVPNTNVFLSWNLFGMNVCDIIPHCSLNFCHFGGDGFILSECDGEFTNLD